MAAPRCSSTWTVRPENCWTSCTNAIAWQGRRDAQQPLIVPAAACLAELCSAPRAALTLYRNQRPAKAATFSATLPGTESSGGGLTRPRAIVPGPALAGARSGVDSTAAIPDHGGCAGRPLTRQRRAARGFEGQGELLRRSGELDLARKRRPGLRPRPSTGASASVAPPKTPANQNAGRRRPHDRLAPLSAEQQGPPRPVWRVRTHCAASFPNGSPNSFPSWRIAGKASVPVSLGVSSCRCRS